MARQFIVNEHMILSNGTRDFRHYLEQLMYMALLDATNQRRNELVQTLKEVENSPAKESDLLHPFGYGAYENSIRVEVGLMPDGWYTSEMELGLNGNEESRAFTRAFDGFKEDVIANSEKYLTFLNDESVAKEIADIGKNIGVLVRYK